VGRAEPYNIEMGNIFGSAPFLIPLLALLSQLRPGGMLA
jgi:hypothetical protein